MKNITMRLYKQHDLDLFYLYKLPDFSLQIAVKKAIQAFANNNNYVIDYPEWPKDKNFEFGKKTAQIHIFLDEVKDKGAIDWIDSISPGYRNSLLKNLTRQYLNRIPTEVYTIIEPLEAEKAKHMTPRRKGEAKHITALRKNNDKVKTEKQQDNIVDEVLNINIENKNDIGKDKSPQLTNETNITENNNEQKKELSEADKVLGSKKITQEIKECIKDNNDDDAFDIFDKLMGSL